MSKIDPTSPPDLSNHKPPANVTFTEQELVNMDPSEREVAERMNLLAAEGIDPTLDEAEIAAIRAKRDEQQTASAAEIKAQPPAAQGEQQAAPAAQEQAPSTPEQAEAPVADDLALLPVGNIAEMEAQRAELRRKQRELAKQWVDGDIEQEAYDAALTEVEAKIDSVGDAIATNRALQQQNEIKVLNHQRATINAIRARGIEIGINYDNKEIIDAFNTAMDLVEAMPANARLSFTEIAEKAHTMVAAMHGFTAAPAPAPAPTTTKPAPRTPPPIPKSLANVPAAEIPNQGAQAQNLSDGIFAGKSAAESEAAWEKLTDAQKKAILGDYA